MRAGLNSLAAMLCVLAASGCGSGGDAGSSNSPKGSTGGTLWEVSGSLPMLRSIDTASGKIGVDVQIGPGSIDVWDKGVAPADGLVWVGRTDGAVVAVNASSGQIEKTIDVITDGGEVEIMLAGGGAAYALSSSSEKPVVIELDAKTFANKAQAQVISDNVPFSSALYEPGTIWALSGSDFALSKVNATTLAVQGRVPLGQNLSDPEGPRGEYDGDGLAALTTSKVWVVDRTAQQLLSVDKLSLQATFVSDLGDLLAPGGPIDFRGNGDSTFLSLPDQGMLVRFDGKTGARTKTYSLGVGVASAFVVTKTKIYATDNHVANDVFEIDIQSGSITNTYPNLRPSVLAVE